MPSNPRRHQGNHSCRTSWFGKLLTADEAKGVTDMAVYNIAGGGSFAMTADPARVNWIGTIAILFVLVLYVTMVYGPIAALLVELFPTRIRYTGMSLPYHIGNGWFGGLLPATAFAMSAATGDIYYRPLVPDHLRSHHAGHRSDLPAGDQGSRHPRHGLRRLQGSQHIDPALARRRVFRCRKRFIADGSTAASASRRRDRSKTPGRSARRGWMSRRPTRRQAQDRPSHRSDSARRR
jgi:hypothetical protein